MAGIGRGDIRQRAWNMLRLALLWARKGGVLRKRLMVELHKFLESIGRTTSTPRILFHRQLSFDKTPILRVTMRRPSSTRFSLPCISAPRVDFGYDFDEASEDEDGGFAHFHGGRSRSICEEEEYEEEEISEEEKGIDSRAEEFISKFYEEMKLQRQISYLQYSMTPNRSIS